MKKILKLLIVVVMLMSLVVSADSGPIFVKETPMAKVGNQDGAKVFSCCGFGENDKTIIPYGTKVPIDNMVSEYVSVIYNNKKYYISIRSLKNEHIADNFTAEITDEYDVNTLLSENEKKFLIPRGAKVSNVQKVNFFAIPTNEPYIHHYIKAEDLINPSFEHKIEKYVVRYLLVDVILRRGPSELFEEVGTLKAETKVKYSNDCYETGGWVYITEGNLSGYVKLDYREDKFNCGRYLGQRLENIPYYYTKDVIKKYDDKIYGWERKDEEYDKYGLKFLTPIDVKYLALKDIGYPFSDKYAFYMKYNGKLVPIHSSNVLEDYNYKLTFKSFECKNYSNKLCRVFDLEGNKLNLEDVFKLNKEYQIKYISYPKYSNSQNYAEVDNLYIDVDGKLYILQYPTDEADDHDIIIDAKKKEPLTEEEKQKQIKESIKTKVIEESPDDITKKSVNKYLLIIGIPVILIIMVAILVIIIINSKKIKVIKNSKKD